METATLTSGFALAFGVLHALEPGHGKTALMTYLTSGKRSVAEGLVIALTSAITHSLAVLIIATISHTLLYEENMESSIHHLGEYLALLSGALIVGLGLWILRKGLSSKPQESSSSACGLHHHEGHHHDHHEKKGSTEKEQRNRFLTSGLLGVATGMIPCPTVVVAYLSGLSSGNSLLGLQNVLLFALGMSVSLITLIVLFSFGALKLRNTLEPHTAKKPPHRLFNWNSFQGSVFIVIGLFTAFYH